MKRAALPLLVASCVLSRATATCGCGPETPIIVIGAGFAGLAAATELVKLNCTNITIIEARDRVGGRAHTYTFPGTNVSVDMGPMWAYNYKIHPLRAIAEENGFDRFPTNWDNISYVNGSDGGRVIDDALFAAWEDEFDDLYTKARRWGGRRPNDKTLKRAVEWATENSPNLEYLTDSSITEFIQWWWYTSAYGIETHESSVNWFDSSRWLRSAECPRLDPCYEYSIIDRGYGALAAIMAEGFDDVRLSSPVTDVAVDYAGVTVTTQGGAQARAAFAVLAAPLPVVRDSIAFDPPLPESVTAALTNRQMGDEEKYVLLFDAQFWPNTEHFLDISGGGGSAAGEYIYWLNGAKYLPGAPPVLTAFVAGRGARRLGRLGDAALEAAMLASLRRLLPAADVPGAARGFARSRWSDDAFTGGCWSNFVPGTDDPSPDLEALQSPIGPEGRDDGSGRLFLAGEHTSRYFWGSVHGAYFSGQDAANEICATAPPCTDDDSWHVRDRPAHGCAWTQGHAARCAMTGTGRSGYAACQATCGSCDGR